MPRLPGAETVQRTAVARPGAGPRVPQMSSQPQTDLGEAVFDATERYQAMQQRQREIDDTVARTKFRKDYYLNSANRVKSFETAGDPTDESRLGGLFQELSDEKNQILSDAKTRKMSPSSLARLDEILTDIEVRAQTSASDIRIQASRALLEDQAGESAAALTAQAFQQPRDVFRIANRVRGEIAEVSKGLPGPRVLALERGALAAVYEAAVRGKLKSEGREAAMELMNAPLVSESLGASKVLQLSQAIKDAPGPARFMTRQEKIAQGIPPEAVVQVRPDGVASVLIQPPKDETIRNQKIANVRSQLMQKNPDMELQKATEQATNIVDRFQRIEIVPQLGVARRVDEITGQVQEIPLGTAIAEITPPPQRRTLWDLADSGAIAGLVPAAKSALGGTAGQIEAVPVATQTIQARQELQTAQNELVRALAINPRFPVAEMNRIRSEVDIEPSMWDSRRSLLSRMMGVKNSLETRLANEEAAARNTALPQETRGFASQAANDIRNFIRRLGAPDKYDPNAESAPQGVPPGSVKIGINRQGKDVWQDPDGKKWVVE